MDFDKQPPAGWEAKASRNRGDSRAWREKEGCTRASFSSLESREHAPRLSGQLLPAGELHALKRSI